MTGSNDKTGLIVVTSLYMLLLVCAGFMGWHIQRRRLKTVGSDVEDEMTTHYLSGRSLDTVVVALTFFASVFSGYTVVGIPSEAFYNGWTSLRWLSTITMVVFASSGTCPRLRKLSLVRNHQSPADFITDRYGSQVLRYTIAFLQLLPAMIYLIAQTTAINNTFNSMFGIDKNNPAAVVVISAVILGYEWLGGLSSVAWTDCVQAGILLSMFVILPITFSIAFGGWVNIDPMTYPKPSFYQVPTADTQYSMWNFTVLNLSSFTVPHFLQRTYAARSMKGLKLGYSITGLAAWLLVVVGIYVGTVGVEVIGEQPVMGSPFAAIMDALMNYSTFGYVIACVAYVASLAAIMSTADSLLIAISQLFTSEIVYPLAPNASPSKISSAGKIVSLFAMVIALLVTLLTTTGLSKLAAIQFGLSLQAVPSFLLGLYASPRNSSWTNLHPWVLAFGALAGFVSTFCIHNLYSLKDPDFSIDAGVTGCVINIVCCIMGELAVRCWQKHSQGSWTVSDDERQTPTWDKPRLARFGDTPLTADLIWRSMKGVYEPFLQGWYVPLVAVLTVVMLPLTGNGNPPLDENGKLAYAPNVVAGIPDWAFCFMMICAALTLLVLYVISRIPDDFPENDKDEIEPDLLQLQRHELNGRFSYDETNIAVSRRRRSSLTLPPPEVNCTSVSSSD